MNNVLFVSGIDPCEAQGTSNSLPIFFKLFRSCLDLEESLLNVLIMMAVSFPFFFFLDYGPVCSVCLQQKNRGKPYQTERMAAEVGEVNYPT